jgi:hypothetical protein
MDELVRWFGEQLDEDERIARGADSSVWPSREVQIELDDPVHHAWRGTQLSPTMAKHIVRHGPVRVLREIEADRELLRQYAEVAANDVDDVEYAHGWANALGLAVRLRATAYRDRPGYRAEEWAP